MVAVMRAAALLLGLLLAAFAVSGGVDAATKRPKPPPIAAAPIDGLRGSLSVTPASLAQTGTQPGAKPASKSAAATLRPIPSVPSISPAGGEALGDRDKGQCRAACAHTYYFCSAGADAGDCPGNWSACLAGCSPSARPLPSVTE